MPAVRVGGEGAIVACVGDAGNRRWHLDGDVREAEPRGGVPLTVDHEGEIFEIYHHTRNKDAALRLAKKPLTRHGSPKAPDLDVTMLPRVGRMAATRQLNLIQKTLASCRDQCASASQRRQLVLSNYKLLQLSLKELGEHVGELG